MHDHSSEPASRVQADGRVGQPHEDTKQAQPAHSMLWMVACCAPMVLVALAIVLGVFGPR